MRPCAAMLRACCESTTSAPFARSSLGSPASCAPIGVSTAALASRHTLATHRSRHRSAPCSVRGLAALHHAELLAVGHRKPVAHREIPLGERACVLLGRRRCDFAHNRVRVRWCSDPKFHRLRSMMLDSPSLRSGTLCRTDCSSSATPGDARTGRRPRVSGNPRMRRVGRSSPSARPFVQIVRAQKIPPSAAPTSVAQRASRRCDRGRLAPDRWRVLHFARTATATVGTRDSSHFTDMYGRNHG
jgi:hypothetical protein